MKTFSLSILLIALLSTSAIAITHAQGKPNSTPAASPTASGQDNGQKIFEQNCSRCHNAPEGFSPRISATIVRHMRVRANLSKADEQKLLRFFNP